MSGGLEEERRVGGQDRRIGGQAALILIMIMAVIGAVSVSVAGQTVENLRSQEIGNISSQAQGAANAGLELAQSLKADVPTTQLGNGNVTYTATYNSSGGDGFVVEAVSEGDVVAVSLAGASGITAINVYWNSDAAIIVSLLSGNLVTGNYTLGRATADPNAGRSAVNRFTSVTSGSYTFKSSSPNFDNKTTIPIDLAADPAPKILRVLVAYQSSIVGIEPVGGTLADGQRVEVNSTGRAENNIVTRISLSKFSERVPAVFDNVLYTNGSLAQ